ncbi:ABC transporter ATP-binding protein [Halobacterium litoreum]|uniref:ABC transporter ATP-binding protein n=1 Tax=Halobacterium litoreum TaxID=2039234 RepID=A0ABD5NEI1_9EURY|nr:ABC transporter ATP-binding protein [Halobacterium litoreum]UHH13441.1 ABC transporter ATP-binding protein [Halobacterium litoreum]
MTDATLAVDGVSFGFGDVSILDDVTATLDAGHLTALVGPNGAGKTTALELLAGLRAPDAGTVTRPDGGARSVAYLPQSPQFRSGFTVRETVAFYADLVDADTDPAALLDRVGLAGAADRRVEALSGGMTRLLGLAQALVGDPPVVVLDEPTSGLDPDVADHIFGVASDLATDDRLVVLASHDLAAVEARADRVVLLADGALALDGAPADLLAETGAETLRDAFSQTVRATDRSSVDVRAVRPGGDA